MQKSKKTEHDRSSGWFFTLFVSFICVPTFFYKKTFKFLFYLLFSFPLHLFSFFDVEGIDFSKE